MNKPVPPRAPTKPKKTIWRHEYLVEDHTGDLSLSNLLEMVEARGVGVEDITIEPVSVHPEGIYRGEEERPGVDVTLSYEEEDPDYDQKMEAYEEAMTTYRENLKQHKKDMIKWVEWDGGRIERLEAKRSDLMVQLADIERQLRSRK